MESQDFLELTVTGKLRVDVIMPVDEFYTPFEECYSVLSSSYVLDITFTQFLSFLFFFFFRLFILSFLFFWHHVFMGFSKGGPG